MTLFSRLFGLLSLRKKAAVPRPVREFGAGSAKIAGIFKPGDKVPEWLLAVDPKGPNAKCDAITFVRNVAIIDINETYHFVPMSQNEGGAFIKGSGNDLTISAASKPLSMPIGIHSMWPIDDPRTPSDVFDINT